MPATGDRITKRKGGCYMARYTVETPNGPKRKTIYGTEYKDVEKKLATGMGDAARGLIFDAGNITTGEYLKRWLKDSVRDTVQESTYNSYGRVVNGRLVSGIGRVKLSRLRPDHIRGLYRATPAVPSSHRS